MMGLEPEAAERARPSVEDGLERAVRDVEEREERIGRRSGQDWRCEEARKRLGRRGLERRIELESFG